VPPASVATTPGHLCPRHVRRDAEAAATLARPCSRDRRCPWCHGSHWPAGTRGSDAERSPRGMALESGCRRATSSTSHDQHADLLRHDATDVPRQDASAASRPATGKPNPEALAAFGRVIPTIGDRRSSRRPQPAASYAPAAYTATHVQFIDRAQKVTLVRWRFVPEDGEKALTDRDLKSMPRTFSNRR